MWCTTSSSGAWAFRNTTLRCAPCSTPPWRPGLCFGRSRMADGLLRMLGASMRTSWLDALMALAVSYVFGQLLAWVYELTYEGLSYSRKFADTLTLLTSIACAFVLLAQRSLLAGLGLVAVVSLVRF